MLISNLEMSGTREYCQARGEQDEGRGFADGGALDFDVDGAPTGTRRKVNLFSRPGGTFTSSSPGD